MDAGEFKRKVYETRDSLTKARGEVLTLFVDTENMVSSLLTNYYAQPSKHSEFSSNFLGDQFVPSIAKISALEKTPLIGDHPKLCNKLRQMNNLRNLIAHSTPFGTEQEVMDNKNGKPVKIADKVKEFEQLHSDVWPVLWEIFEQIVKDRKERA